MNGFLMTRSKIVSNIAIVVVGVTSILNLFWVVSIYIQRYEATAANVAAGGSPPFFNQSIIARDMMMTAALIVAGLSLASKRGLGLIVSLIALSWVFWEYVRWYFWTKRMLASLNLTRIRLEAQDWYLYDATTWNLLVLLIVLILLIWEVVMLILILESSLRGGGNSPGAEVVIGSRK